MLTAVHAYTDYTVILVTASVIILLPPDYLILHSRSTSDGAWLNEERESL